MPCNIINQTYYTYDITNPIEVTTGNDIYIRVKYQTTGYTWPIPAEEYSEGYAHAQIESDCFWISPTGTGNWTPLGNDTDYKDDPCVKLYTTETAYVGTENEIIQSMKFELNQNYPNPFNPTTSITYEIPKESNHYNFLELDCYII